MSALPVRFFAVVDAKNPRHVFEQCGTAMRNGADGVFLINHGVSPGEMIAMAKGVRATTKFLGVNFLGLNVREASLLASQSKIFNAVWSDYAEKAYNSKRAQTVCRSSGMELFGGVAFKGQPGQRSTLADYRLRALETSKNMDVVTTSGEATGTAPPLEKVHAMGLGVNGRRLAVASGVSAGMVAQFARHGATDFLVRTSLLREGSNAFDERAVRDMAAAVRKTNKK